MRLFNRKVKILQVSVKTKHIVILCLIILDIFLFNFVLFAYDSLSRHVVQETKQYALQQKPMLLYAETVSINGGWKVKSALIASVLLSYALVFSFSHRITIEPLTKDNA